MIPTGADAWRRDLHAGNARRMRDDLPPVAETTCRDGVAPGRVAARSAMITLGHPSPWSHESTVAAVASTQLSAPAPTGPQG